MRDLYLCILFLKLKYTIYIIHIGAALAAQCLLVTKRNTPKWDILATGVAVYFDNKLRKLKLQSIRPAKAREKPQDNVENRIMGCGERENSLRLLRMLRKRAGRPHLAISMSQRTETPSTKYCF